MLYTGFRGLLRLGDMTMPDKLILHDPARWSLQSSVIWLPNGYSFCLTKHQTDQAFDGAEIVILDDSEVNAWPWFTYYLTSWDHLFPFNPYLWVTSSETVPTQGWFMKCLQKLIPSKDYAGQSMRAGGATWLALHFTSSSWWADGHLRHFRLISIEIPPSSIILWNNLIPQTTFLNSLMAHHPSNPSCLFPFFFTHYIQ